MGFHFAFPSLVPAGYRRLTGGTLDNDDCCINERIAHVVGTSTIVLHSLRSNHAGGAEVAGVVTRRGGERLWWGKYFRYVIVCACVIHGLFLSVLFTFVTP